jgi:hypothetical protein
MPASPWSGHLPKDRRESGKDHCEKIAERRKRLLQVQHLVREGTAHKILGQHEITLASDEGLA